MTLTPRSDTRKPTNPTSLVESKPMTPKFTRKTGRGKAAKPGPDFPLFPHATGRWARGSYSSPSTAASGAAAPSDFGTSAGDLIGEAHQLGAFERDELVFHKLRACLKTQYLSGRKDRRLARLGRHRVEAPERGDPAPRISNIRWNTREPRSRPSQPTDSRKGGAELDRHPHLPGPSCGRHRSPGI
jgi:hypothetical protein